MDQTRVCGLALAVLGLGAASAAASVPGRDCQHYDRGTEIVGNIAERFYQPNDEKTALVFKVLMGMKKDAEDAKLLEESAIAGLDAYAGEGSGGRCSARRAGLVSLVGLLDEEIKAADAAIEACRGDIHQESLPESCHAAAVKVMDLDYKIGLDEQGAALGPNDGELIKFMVGMGKDGCDAPGTWEIQTQVHQKIAPRPCAREGEYCYATRIGKLRQAREELGRVSSSPLKDVVSGVNRPLLKEAEHKFWYLRDHIETDNREVFNGVLLLTKGLLLLQDGLKSCSW